MRVLFYFDSNNLMLFIFLEMCKGKPLYTLFQTNIRQITNTKQAKPAIIQISLIILNIAFSVRPDISKIIPAAAIRIFSKANIGNAVISRSGSANTISI